MFHLVSSLFGRERFRGHPVQLKSEYSGVIDQKRSVTVTNIAAFLFTLSMELADVTMT